MTFLHRWRTSWTAVAGVATCLNATTGRAQEITGLSPQALSASVGGAAATASPYAGGAFQSATAQLGYLSPLFAASASAILPIPYGTALPHTAFDAGMTAAIPLLPKKRAPLHLVASGQYATQWTRGGATARLQWGAMGIPELGRNPSGVWIGGRVGRAREDSVGFTAWTPLVAPFIAPVGGPAPGGNYGVGAGVWHWQWHTLFEAAFTTGHDGAIQSWQAGTGTQSDDQSSTINLTVTPVVVTHSTLLTRAGAHWVANRITVNVVGGTVRQVSLGGVTPTRGWYAISGGVRAIGPVTIIGSCGTNGTISPARTPVDHSSYGAIGVSLSAWPIVHHRPAVVDTDPGTNRLVARPTTPPVTT